MARNLTKTLRKVFLSSLALITASNSNSSNKINVSFVSEVNENKDELLFKRNNNLPPKLILKKSSENEWRFMSHRSHRSHSSHSSHRSHYSSSTNSGTTPTTTNKSVQSVDKETTTSDLKLGSRTLKKGMSGTDVTELINILIQKEYLKLDDGGKVVTGIYTFDETVENAIKKFQKDNGLSSDGICGATTIYYLKNK